jgi:predicted Zn-dependent peptidase
MAWEQIEVHDGVTLHHDVVDGLSSYWVEGGGSFRAVLMFRVGMADETLPTRGACHLVEHLAIEPRPRLYAHNGWCGVDSTGFWAEGERDEVLDYLTGVARRLHPLPRDRMVAERQILATEGSQRGGSIVTTLLSCRWGARTYGTASYDEFGLFRLSEDEAQAWADRYFVADNAVLFMTGEPPEGFGLELPRGERHILPAAEPISNLLLPTGISLGQGGVGVGLEVDRSAATGLGLALLASAATARLRHELGVTYHVGADYQLAGPDTAHLTIAADCLDTNAEQVASTLLAVIDNIASTGPEDAELEYEHERFRRAIKAPADALDWFATGDLIGVTRERLLEQVSSAAQVTREEVAAVVQAGADKLIMIVPSHVAPPDRCRPYPHFSERAVSGKRLRVKGMSGWLSGRRAGVILGDEGLTAIYGEDQFATIEWSDCEVVLHWSNGSVVVIGRDGDKVPVLVERFGRNGAQAALDELKRHVPADRFVLMPD